MTVKQRQHLLAYLGYYSGGADGIWGPKSHGAAKAFQRDFGGLAVTGIVDGETEAALRAAVTEGMPETGEDFWKEILFFSREEFRCKCGGRYCNGFPAEMQKAAVLIADRARAYFGKPAYVSSGLRCRQHNQNCGGVADSQHMYGEAIDLRIQGVSGDALLAYLQKQPEVRYAYRIDGNHVHFDIPKGAR